MSSRRPGCITTATTARRIGATGSRSRSSPTCSRRTSPTASMPTTTPGRSCAGPRSVPGSSRSPAPRAGCQPRDRRVFEAAAEAHRRTGVPILTHCEHGTGALEQIRVLRDHGVAARHIVLSHVDRVVDRGYHRELLGTGAYGEYDGSFRWQDDEPNGTLAAHPLDGRGRARRADRPRHGRRPASLLPGPRRRTRARLAARRLHPAPGRRPGSTSRFATACSSPIRRARSPSRPRRRAPPDRSPRGGPHGRPPHLDARHRAHRRFLHDDPARPARPRPGGGRLLAQRGARDGVPRALVDPRIHGRPGRGGQPSRHGRRGRRAPQLPPRGGGRAGREGRQGRSSARSRSGGRPRRRSGCSMSSRRPGCSAATSRTCATRPRRSRRSRPSRTGRSAT